MTRNTQGGIAVAICSAASSGVGMSFNFELPKENGIPEWIELVPAGRFTGHDGRSWVNNDPETAIANTVKKGVAVPVDLNHSTELAAPLGLPSPAVGRIRAKAENFEVRDGAIWGRVSWNREGKAAIEGEEYFYYSPAFYHDKKTLLVDGLKSVGLTNTPNLTLTALNQEEKPTMDLKKLLALLGLAEDGTMDDVIAAVTKLKADKEVAQNNAKTPSSVDFVPRADFNLAINRAETAEQAIADSKAAAQEIAINAEIDQAIKDGKVAPASREYHVASCKQEGGLDRFKAMVSASPVIVGGDSGLDGKKPEGTGTALNAEQEQIADQLGISHTDYAAELAGEG